MPSCGGGAGHCSLKPLFWVHSAADVVRRHDLHAVLIEHVLNVFVQRRVKLHRLPRVVAVGVQLVAHGKVGIVRITDMPRGGKAHSGVVCDQGASYQQQLVFQHPMDGDLLPLGIIESPRGDSGPGPETGRGFLW